jgi:hypothetical protein
MEYRRLVQLDNTYPNLRNYKKSVVDNQIILSGIYSDINQIEFEYTDIKSVTPVDNTKFRFIIGIKKDEGDTNIKYFTSNQFYRDFELSLNESNPYLLIGAFDVRIFVINQFFDVLKIFEENKKLEETDLVYMNKNLFIDDKSEIDYISLIQYIDWLVDTPSNLDFETQGVKSAELLGIWTQLEIDPDTGKALSKKTVQEKRDAKNLESKLKDLQEELNKIKSDIDTYSSLIRNDDYPSIGLSTSSLTVNGKLEKKIFQSGKHFLNTKKQNNDIRNALIAYQNELRSKQVGVEKTIAELTKTTTNSGVEGNVTNLDDKNKTEFENIDKRIQQLKEEIQNLSPFNANYIKNRKEIVNLEKEKRDIKAAAKEQA